MKSHIFPNALLAFAALSLSTFTFAAKPATPHLTTITVAVEGMTCPACADELQLDLAKTAGVAEEKVTLTPGQVSAQLDESKMSAGKFVTLIAAHRQFMDHAKTYGAKLVLYIDTAACAKETKMCAGCFTEIPKVLKAVKGVSDVTLDETGKIATVGFAKNAAVSTSTLAKALAESDYKFTVTFIKTDAPACMAPETAMGGMPGMDMGCPSCEVAK